MTTSLSNASTAAAPPERAPATEPPPLATTVAGPSRPAETGGTTTASRFIILILCLAVALSTLAFGAVQSWSIAVFQLGAALIVVLWAADAWMRRSLRVSRNVLLWPLAGLFVVGLIQLLPFGGGERGPTAAGLPVETVRALSLDPYATRFVLIQVGALFVYFAATLVFIDSPRRLRLIVRFLGIFGFLLALYSLLQHFVSPDQIYWLRQPAQAIPFGPFVNRHHFAACMEMLLAVPLGLLFAGAVESDRRLLYFLSVALMSIALVVTGSRGGILSLAVEVLFIVSLAGLTRRNRSGSESDAEKGSGSRVRAALLRAALGLILVLGLLGSALLFGGEESLSRLVGTVNSDDPTSGRLQFWRGTLGVIKEYPLLGAGLGAFHVAYTRHDPLTGLFRLEQAHNDYLQVLADAGIIGGALGLFFVVALFRMGLKRTQSADKFRRGVATGALAGCFGVLVHSFFDFPLHITSNALLFLTLAALATLDGRVEDESAARPGRRRHRRRSRRHSQRSPQRSVEPPPPPALESGVDGV